MENMKKYGAKYEENKALVDQSIQEFISRHIDEGCGDPNTQGISLWWITPLLKLIEEQAEDEVDDQINICRNEGHEPKVIPDIIIATVAWGGTHEKFVWCFFNVVRLSSHMGVWVRLRYCR